MVITIHIVANHGNYIRLVKTTTGEGVDLTGRNLRIVLRGGFVEIHYNLRKGPGRKCGSATICVDKEYTEVLADSCEHFHGRKFGKTLGDLMKKVHDNSGNRGKLTTLVQKHREAGRAARPDRILQQTS